MLSKTIKLSTFMWTGNNRKRVTFFKKKINDPWAKRVRGHTCTRTYGN